MSDEELEALVVWKGDPNDPHFDRIAFGRSCYLAALEDAARRLDELFYYSASAVVRSLADKTGKD